MPRSRTLSARRQAARHRAIVDELHELAADEGISLDEQLRIEAAIAAAHASGAAVDVAGVPSPPAPSRAAAAASLRSRRP